MADYQRILSYLYRYEKSEKKECLGFIKAEQKSAILKLTIQINDERLLHGMELKLCFYEKQGEHWGVRKLDSIITEEDKEEFHQMYSKEQLPEGFDIKKQSGVVLYYQEEYYYGSVWIGEEIPAEVLESLQWKKKKEPVDHADNIDDINDINAGNLDENVDYTAMRNLAENTDERIDDIDISEQIKNADDTDISEQIKNADDTDVSKQIKNADDTDVSKQIENADDTDVSKQIENADDTDVSNQAESTDNIKEQEQDIANFIAADNNDKIGNTGLNNMEVNMDTDIEEANAPVDEFEKMWINSVKQDSPVDNIFNTAFYEGYKVSIAKLKKLGEEARQLADNQFLLKGYERYKHLLMGKVRYAGEKRYCVGVPGIYENREKYMAELYQFPIFLSLTENRMKTGNFGYWLYLLKGRE